MVNQIKKIRDEKYVKTDDGTTKGELLWWDGSNWTYLETSEMVWDDTDKALGINKTNPFYRLDIGGDTSRDRIGIGTTNQLKIGELRATGKRQFEAINGMSFRCANTGEEDLILTSGLADFKDTNIQTTGTGTFDQINMSSIYDSSGTNMLISNDGSGNPILYQTPIVASLQNGYGDLVIVLDAFTLSDPVADSIDWGNRILYASDGSDVILNYNTVGLADFDDSDIETTGTGTFGNLAVDNININGAVISSNTGAISFSNENLTTTGIGKFTGGVVNKIASISWGEDPPTTDGGIWDAFGNAWDYDDGWTALLYDSVLFSIFQVMSWNDEWYVSTRMDAAPYTEPI